MRLFLSILSIIIISVSCSEAEFESGQIENRSDDAVAEDPSAIPDQNASVSQDGDENDADLLIDGEISSISLKTGQDEDTLGGDDATDTPGLGGDDADANTAPTLKLYFLNPAGARVDGKITVSNADAFKVGWESTNTSSCDLFSRLESAAAFGSDLNPENNTNGIIDIKRITADHRYKVVCEYTDENGDAAEIIKTRIAEVSGGWFNAFAVDCNTFCSGIGKTNSPSPEGFKCTSGENRPWSAIGVVDFSPTGCWHSCAAPEGAAASSSGQHCWHPTQKKDYDSQDRTVGCFCK